MGKRRSSSENTKNRSSFDSLIFLKEFFLHYGDISDGLSVLKIIEKTKPDEI